MQIDHELARRIEKLELELADQINGLRESICSGACGSHEEYRHVVGRIQGLSTALLLVETRLMKFTDPETDD